MRDPFLDLLLAGLIPVTPPINSSGNHLKTEHDSKKELNSMMMDILETIAITSEGQVRSGATILIKTGRVYNGLREIERFADPDKHTTVTEEQRQAAICFLDNILAEIDSFFKENPKPNKTAFD